MRKLLCCVILLLLTASLLCGCGVVTEQTVTCGELQLTIPTTFIDWSADSAADGLAFNYAGSKVGICGTFEDKATLLELVPDIDAKTYADLFVQTNGLTSPVELVDGIPRFSYTVEGDPSATYLCGVFESESNFWVVQAYCEIDDYEDCKAEMWKYILTATMK